MQKLPTQIDEVFAQLETIIQDAIHNNTPHALVCEETRAAD